MFSQQALHLLIGSVAQRTLRADFSKHEIKAIAADVVDGYFARKSSLPKEPSRGGNLMVQLAGLTICVYRAVLERKHDEADALRITTGVTWAIYSKMAKLPELQARLRAKDPLVRLKRATDSFRQQPFGPPAYIMDDVDAGADVVAFDVKRCAVAEVFRSEGLEDLCTASWCDLDFPLARRWGGWLERDQTLVTGAPSCTFRWHVGTPPESAIEQHREPS